MPEKNVTAIAKPFLKWAGGKTQLLDAIEKHMPPTSKLNELTYVEPFAGSGAVLFRVLQSCPAIKKAVINDINTDLVTAYHVIKKEPEKLIRELGKIQEQYYQLNSEEAKKTFFLEKREQFNHREVIKDSITRSTLLIFLNKTCFNGLYRVNSRNSFNVPHGRYVRPKICDETTIKENSKILQKVTILNGDFEETLTHVEGKGFFYFDPPYRPLNKTSSFTAYAAGTFDDTAQTRLAGFARKLHKQGHYWLLSNSDPRNINSEDDFFDRLYEAYSIRRIPATRMINSKGDKRGAINELLIYNYEVK